MLTSVLLGAALALTGCSQGSGATTDMTLDEAEQITTADVDALIARIDPNLIERIDDVTSQSTGCRDIEDDPDQRVRQWENRRYVRFVEGVENPAGLEILDTLVTAQVADGWTLARDMPEKDGTVRRVQLFSPTPAGDEARDAYGLNVSGGGEEGRISLNISAVSPCFEAPGKTG
jgi:hypothetical protein